MENVISLLKDRLSRSQASIDSWRAAEADALARAEEARQQIAQIEAASVEMERAIEKLS